MRPIDHCNRIETGTNVAVVSKVIVAYIYCMNNAKFATDECASFVSFLNHKVGLTIQNVFNLRISLLLRSWQTTTA